MSQSHQSTQNLSKGVTMMTGKQMGEIRLRSGLTRPAFSEAVSLSVHNLAYRESKGSKSPLPDELEASVRKFVSSKPTVAEGTRRSFHVSAEKNPAKIAAGIKGAATRAANKKRRGKVSARPKNGAVVARHYKGSGEVLTQYSQNIDVLNTLLVEVKRRSALNAELSAQLF